MADLRRKIHGAATWWERAAAVVAGEPWLVRRVHGRLMRADEDYSSAFHLAARLRGYKAVQPGKGKASWLQASDRSGDAELVPDLGPLRNRSRATERDDSVGSGIVRTLKRGSVGTGLRPQVRTKARTDGQADAAAAERKNDAIETVARELLNRVDRANALPHGLHQALVYTRQTSDGDVFLRAVATEPGEPVWIEVVEGDRVATPPTRRPVDPLGKIVAGVEKDRWGRPVAYHVARRHPGDQITTGVTPGSQAIFGASLMDSDFERVPHGPECALTRSRVTRGGQTRGEPLFHACVQDLRDLDVLVYSSLKRTQIAACLAAFLTTSGDALDVLQLTAEDYGYQLDQKIEPGMIFRLFPGESLEIANPSTAAPGLAEFVMLLAKRIGAAVELSPQAVLRAWEGISYSAARTIKIDDRQTYRAERSAFVLQVLDWEYSVVMEDALLRGDRRLVEAGVELEDLATDLVEWIGDEEQWVDPQAETQAVELMLDMGLTSLQIECQRLGRDWRDVLKQRLEAEKAEADMRKALKLPPRAESAAPPLKVVPGGKPQAEPATEAA